MRVRAPGYDQSQPITIPVGCRVYSFEAPLTVTLERAGELWVSVTDDRRRGKPFKAHWSVEVMAGGEASTGARLGPWGERPASAQ